MKVHIIQYWGDYADNVSIGKVFLFKWRANRYIKKHTGDEDDDGYMRFKKYYHHEIVTRKINILGLFLK